MQSLQSYRNITITKKNPYQTDEDFFYAIKNLFFILKKIDNEYFLL